MSEKEGVVRNVFGSGRDLYMDEWYYISYSDQKEKMSEAQYRERYGKYLEIVRWPETNIKFKTLAELHPEENPNYIKITGRMIMEWCEKGYVPQFDKYFEKTRRLVMVPVEAWEFFNRRSRMLRKRGRNG